MSTTSVVQPALLSRINELQVLRTLQECGPLSRAEVARHSGISAPTASKAVESLLRAGLLEEGNAPEFARGRPGKKLRLATETAQVLGLVIDADVCCVLSAGLDGQVHEERTTQFSTPSDYEALIRTAADHAARLMTRPGVTAMGLAVSVPGLIDYRQQQGVLSPNVPQTNGRSPSQDLAARLGIECIMVQESHALCLAERHYGDARGMEDFAVMDVGTGVGLGVMSGGRLLTGHCGLAGEIGHITVDAAGDPCGCGNRGCLETIACDSALARAISRRAGRRLDIEQVIQLARAGQLSPGEELERTCGYLAIGLAAVINLFNPSTLFVHGRLFALDEGVFARVVEEAGRRALPPSFAGCRIVLARGSKQQGAIAAVVEHVTRSVAPELDSGPGTLPLATKAHEAGATGLALIR